MRRLALATVFLLVCPIALAQHHMHRTAAPEDNLRLSPCSKDFAPAHLDPNLQKVRWAVTGKSRAKRFFLQGMTQYYGFNYEEALRNFRAAAESDKSMAMARWGIALAAGPNINLGMDKPCHELANFESDAARAMAKNQPKLTPVERTLIDALPLRYDYSLEKPDEEKVKAALQAYSDALGRMWNAPSPEKQPYQNDQNFGALYAESLIELHPWALYDNHYKPTSPDTKTIIDVLETAMGVNKRAIGANHYYIHTAEAGPAPVDALPSANRFLTLVEASGHLVHMSSHIYLLLGKYTMSLASNADAAVVDLGQYAEACRGSFLDYSKSPTCPQLYYGHYLSHNFFFGSVSATFSGQSKTAMAMACNTRAHAERFVTNEPGLQRYMTAPLMTLVVNRNWDAIEHYPAPPPDCYIQPPFTESPKCHILNSIWYWAQGMESATRGNTGKANEMYTAMVKEKDATVLNPPSGWGNNAAVTVLAIAQSILEARINWPSNPQSAITSLKDAVDRENDLTYDEPPQWFTPAREALGGAYLQTKDYQLAEKTFSDELDRHKKSGRALYGKLRALKKQNKSDNDPEVIKARTDFCTAWKYADYAMTDADLWPVLSGNSDPGITCERKVQPKPAPSKCVCKEQTLSSPLPLICPTKVE